MPATSYELLSSWDFENHHVINITDPKFISYDSTLIAAGPPKASTATDLIPIGLVENFGIGQGLQMQRILEIGSTLNYIIPGNVLGNGQLGSVIYNGPSLLSYLYNYYTFTLDGESAGIPEANGGINLADKLQKNPPGTIIPSPDTSITTKGFFGFNLGSNLFKRPAGIAVIFHDSENNPVSAIFLEDVYISGHQFSINSGAVVLMEMATFSFEKMVPISVTIPK